MENCGIYQILNLVNGHCYIGRTTNIKVRWRNHLYCLNHCTHPNPHLQAAWNKYGAASFEFRIVQLLPENFTKEAEGFWARYFSEDGIKPEYNIIGPDQQGLMRHSAGTIEKIRRSMQGKLNRRGKPISEQARKNLKATRRKKKIVGFNLESLEMRFYNSIADAAVDGFVKSNISHCIAGRQRSHRGFLWFCADEVLIGAL